MKVLEYKELATAMEEDFLPILMVVIEDTKGVAGYGKGKVFRCEHYFTTECFDESCSFYMGRYSGAKLNVQRIPAVLYNFAKDQSIAIAKKKLTPKKWNRK